MCRYKYVCILMNTGGCRCHLLHIHVLIMYVCMHAFIFVCVYVS